jgi:hypothetical protein
MSAHLEGGAPRRQKGIHHANSSGVALVLTLGLLAILTLAVVAFVVTMRIERLAANNTLNRTMARQYIDVGLNEAMGTVDAALGNQSCYPPAILPATNAGDIYLFQGAVTNLLPLLLAQQAAAYTSGWWVTISETNAAAGNATVQVGRVSYLVVNLSGMLDVHSLTNNARCAALGEPNASVTNRLSTSAYQRVFLTQPDLTAANNGIAVSNLVTFSYDPNPDVFFTNNIGLGTRTFGLTNRFNINSATQYVGNYTSQQFQDNWLAPVSNLLASAGVLYSDQIAWNILNYIDPGRIPITNEACAYRTNYGVKNVPLINKVLLEHPGSNYSVSVELWYPFVPNTSPSNTVLWVGVYTNQAPSINTWPAPASDLSFSTNVCSMNYGGATEFVVATMTNAVNFTNVDNAHPVWIWPRVLVGGTCVDEAMVTENILTNWTATGCWQFADPRANNTFADAAWYSAATPGMGATNINCTLSNLPLVVADAPMLSAGELRHIYAPGMGLPNDQLDLSTSIGAACRDRFTACSTNSPVHGLVQANSPYTNVWKTLLSDISVGWTNAVSTDSQKTLIEDPDPQHLPSLAALTANSQINPGGRGWTCFAQMLPQVASNLASVIATPNAAYDVRGDILAGIADRVSFRQNLFLVIVCGQRISPLGRVLADQRAAITVVRDAFTGRWVVDHVVWLTE